MSVCVCSEGGGVVSTKLTGLGGTAPSEGYHFDSNGMHIYFYEGHSIDKLYFSGLIRGAPIPSLPVHKFRSLKFPDLWVARGKAGPLPYMQSPGVTVKP